MTARILTVYVRNMTTYQLRNGDHLYTVREDRVGVYEIIGEAGNPTGYASKRCAELRQRPLPAQGR